MANDTIERLLGIVKKHRNLLLYGIIGVSGALLDFLLFLALTQTLNVPATIATFLSVSAGIVNNFFLNAFLNFKKKDRLLARLLSFYSVGIFGAIISVVLIALFMYLGTSEIIAKALTILPVVLGQYIINKRLAFSETTDIRKSLYLIIVTLVGLLGCVILFRASTEVPLTYDESYNMQVSSLLAKDGLYATYGTQFQGQIKLFDPFISTGPTLLVPIALLFKLVGEYTIFYRIITSLISLGVILAAYAVFLNITRSRLKSAVIASMIALAYFAVMGTHLSITAIGEPLGILFILAAAFMLDKGRYAVASLLVGLAILTKFLLIVCVLPLAIFFIYRFRNMTPLKNGVNTLLMLSVVALPSLLFEIYRLLSLGSLSVYKASLIEFVKFFKMAGSGIGTANATPLEVITDRLLEVSRIVYGSGKVALLIIASLIGIGFGVFVFNTVKKIKIPEPTRQLITTPSLALLSTSGLLLLLWWLLGSDKAMYRHAIVPLLLLVIPAIYVGFVSISGLRKKYRNLVSCTLVIVSIFGLAHLAISKHIDPSQKLITLSSQQKSMEQLNDFYKDKQLYHTGWWQNPEYMLYANKTSKQVDYVSSNANQYLLLSQTHKVLAPEFYEGTVLYCSELRPIGKEYTICRMKTIDANTSQ